MKIQLKRADGDFVAVTEQEFEFWLLNTFGPDKAHETWFTIHEDAGSTLKTELAWQADTAAGRILIWGDLAPEDADADYGRHEHLY